MNTTPHRDEWASPETRSLLDQAREIQPRSQAKAALWERIAAADARRRWMLYAFLPAAATATAVVALLVWRAGPRAAPEVAWAPDVLLQVSADAVYAAAPGAERKIALTSGTLTAEVGKQAPGLRFAVVTPQVEVIVVGTRFKVQVREGLTQVSVERGHVRVESRRGASVDLAAGEAIRSDDPLLAAPAPSAAAAFSSCEAGASEVEKDDCYQRVAKGDDLAAQNALYLLGLRQEKQGELEAAVGRWQELARRFPEGALTPEAQLSTLRLSVQLRRFDDALATAAAFLERFPADSRRPGVTLIQAKLQCGHLRQLELALKSFAVPLATEVAPDIRQEALFSMGTCQASMGDAGAAARSWQAYLSQFPEGPHFAEARRLLGGE